MKEFQNWKVFLKLAIILTVCVLVFACAESGDDSPPPQDDYDYELIWDLDLDSLYANEQGIEGAAEYGNGEPPYRIEFHYPEDPVACFYADTENGRVTGALLLPWEWTSVIYVQNLQLILAMTYDSEATGRESLYEHGMVELYHVTTYCELREAATMDIVTSETFEGNNAFPETVVRGASTTTDHVNSQLVEDWLKPYVDP